MTVLGIPVLVGLALLLVPGFARAEEPERYEPASRSPRQVVREIIAERAEANGVSAWAMDALAGCESRFDPGAVGSLGELGLFQLHPRGLLPLFYRLGYSDPWSAWQQADFAAWAIAHGLGGHWSCWGGW